MPKTLPPLTWFRAFDSAARHLSFTRAGAELGLTQSAISQHVRALEDRLGAALFIRKPRGLALTEAGRRLVPDVATAMASLTSATAAFDPSRVPDELSIAASASIAQWILAPRLAGFQAQNPGISLRLITAVWPDDFSGAGADVEIRFGAQDVVGHQAEVLLPNRMTAVLSPDLRPARADAIDWRAIAHLPLIPPVGISAQWRDVLKLAGVAQPRDPVLFVDTHGLAADLACAGAGVALTHALIVADAVAAGRLIALPMPEVPAREGYYLARHPTAVPAAQGAFIDWFKAVVSGLVAPFLPPQADRS